MNNKIKGKKGEDIASKYLKNKGYEIICRNYKTETGEVDIIATDGQYLVFVEVKLRKNEDLGLPCEAVGRTKQRKISEVAAAYIASRQAFDAAVRFDVIEIYEQEQRINHIENAFDSFLRY